MRPNNLIDQVALDDKQLVVIEQGEPVFDHLLFFFVSL